ncbi:MAG TPA: STELLO glycosyltransferase family protein [Pyrinomonadaceae bacterium]|nr:STELLO glycosyltransferase family protein [Pyrinomonadaceae bacterium]
MKPEIAIVVTSIAKPNQVLQTLARGCRERGHQFIVIGDEASPKDFQLEGCRFYGLEEQYATAFKLAKLCPTRHYARKNLGYLLAVAGGASIIVETDDDNLPYEEFWRERVRHQAVSTIEAGGWVNVYRYFSEANLWPRGFPLEHVRDEIRPFDSLSVRDVDAPIQQGLADENPDVDAIYRLVLELPQSFRKDRRLALNTGSWSPFNSQNTTWWRDAFPLLYLPAYCSFRMTDIWRSFVAQRIAWANGWSVLFHEPTVWQERNEHNLMRDFKDEVPGYLHNSAICEALDRLQLPSGVEHLGDNLHACYETLVSMSLVDRKELPLVAAWIDDLKSAVSNCI